MFPGILIHKAAKRIGVTRQRVHQLIKEGEIRVVGIEERRLLVDVRDVEKQIKARQPAQE